MKKIVVLLTLIFAANCWAQTDLHDWNNTRNIPAGSQIWIKGAHGRCSGDYVSASDNDIRLQEVRHSFLGGKYAHLCVVPRADVREVRFARRLASAAVGAAIGAGVGAGIGYGVEVQYPNWREDGHLLSGITGFVGALVGAGVGNSTGFLHGAKIYVAP